MTVKVGVREFRAELAEYIDGDEPVAVTRHGRTVGVFIPARADLTAELAAFTEATSVVRRMLQAEGADEDGIVAEFDAARRGASRS